MTKRPRPVLAMIVSVHNTLRLNSVDITLETLLQNTNVYTDCVGAAIGFTDPTEGCPVFCNEQRYSVTVSTAMWPSLVYQVGTALMHCALISISSHLIATM